MVKKETGIKAAPYDARVELAQMMSAELAPELSERAAAILEITTRQNNLNAEQIRRVSIQLSLSESLGIIDLVPGSYYPDDDAANLTLLSLRHKRRKRAANAEAEAAKQYLSVASNLNTRQIRYSRNLFASETGATRAISFRKEQREIIDAGKALLGEWIGLAGGSKTLHALKMYLGEQLSKQSQASGSTATLGGIPAEICRESFNYTPPKVINRHGQEVDAPTIVINITEATKAVKGSTGGQDMKIIWNAIAVMRSSFYFRRESSNKIVGTPAIVGTQIIVEREDNGEAGARNYGYMILSLNPDFATEAIEIEGELRPKDYVSIPSGKTAELSGNSLFNALIDYILFHKNKSGVHKVKARSLKQELIEQCPRYKNNPQDFPDDFKSVAEAIGATGICKVKTAGDYIVFTYPKER